MRLKRRFKTAALPLLVLCLMVVMSVNTRAAEERTKITSIRLSISSSIEAGSYDGDIDVTTTSTRFTVGEVELLDNDNEWEVGDTPKAKVWLYADDDYYFSSTSSSIFSFTGGDASFVSAKTEDNKSAMVVTFKLNKLEGALDVEDVEWEGDSAVGYWSDTDGAKSYQIRLYRSSSSVTSAITVNGTSYNFASHITKSGDYSFQVRAVGSSSSNRGEWIESDTWYVDTDLLAKMPSKSSGTGTGTGTGTGSGTSAGGTWQQNGVGWWYRKSDGSWPANSWLFVNNYWYFFNSNGYMATGWVQISNKWYYCDITTGAMYASRKTPDGLTVGADGVWLGY